MKRSGPLFLALLLAACSPATTNQQKGKTGVAAPPLSSASQRDSDWANQWNCLREKNLALVSAHRGQPDQTWPENALSSLRRSQAAGLPLLEIDIATTRDGVLILMHDEMLDRTTNGTGKVSDRDSAYVTSLKLKKPDGTIVDETVPRLDDVLSWGRNADVRFQLDVKRSTRFEDVVALVRRADMRERVVIITYTLADAEKVHALDPGLIISTSLGSAEEIALATKTIKADRLLGWTGTRIPNPALNSLLRAAGIEALFGTLGRPGQRLDDVYLADGNPSEYADLVSAGITMIATDAPIIAQQAIGTGYAVCFK